MINILRKTKKKLNHIYLLLLQIFHVLFVVHIRKEYLTQHKLKQVNNKELLVKLFFDFHNAVNKNKNKQQQLPEILLLYQNNNITDCACNYINTWIKAHQKADT